MKKYVCDTCGYVYDPEIGDPENGIEPGTAFEDLPEDWVCPLCGVGKEDLNKSPSKPSESEHLNKCSLFVLSFGEFYRASRKLSPAAPEHCYRIAGTLLQSLWKVATA